MYRKKTIEEQDIFKYVLSDQLIHQGILSKEMEEERKMTMRNIANKYVDFLDNEQTSDKRRSVSLGIVKRRNAMLKQILENALPPEEFRILLMHVYMCIEYNIQPEERILTAKVNVDYE